jgi:hypothetical protein
MAAPSAGAGGRTTPPPSESVETPHPAPVEPAAAATSSPPPAAKAATMPAPSNVLSSLFMTYLVRVLLLGASRPLQTDDLGTVLPQDECAALTARFDARWADELRRAGAAKVKPSISRALVRTLPLTWVAAIVAFFVSSGALFLPPLILQQLVGALQGTVALSTAMVWMQVTALLVLPVVATLLQTWHNNVMARLGTQMRTVLTGAIFRKSLVLRNDGAFTTGEIVTRMSVDAALPLRFVVFASSVLVAPPTVAVALWLIYREVGVSTFAGLAFIVLSIPASGVLVRSLFRLRFASMRKADARVKLTNEVLSGIRLAKALAWCVFAGGRGREGTHCAARHLTRTSLPPSLTPSHSAGRRPWRRWSTPSVRTSWRCWSRRP